MNRLAVTINVGGGPGSTPRRQSGMLAWAEVAAATRSPAIVFAQEVPSEDWLNTWRAFGYTVTLGQERHWRIRSALITSPEVGIQPLRDHDVPNGSYHGSYMAATNWTNSPVGNVVLASVHASPTIADPDRYGWVGDTPAARNGGGDDRHVPLRCWDSDYVLATLGTMSLTSSVLAAGDFNESLLDDYDETGERRGTWASEYFATAEEVGFVDVSRIDGSERLPTRGVLQLDHALASGGAAQLVQDGGGVPFLDDQWDKADPRDVSDHRALWFPINV